MIPKRIEMPVQVEEILGKLREHGYEAFANYLANIKKVRLLNVSLKEKSSNKRTISNINLLSNTQTQASQHHENVHSSVYRI